MSFNIVTELVFTIESLGILYTFSDYVLHILNNILLFLFCVLPLYYCHLIESG